MNEASESEKFIAMALSAIASASHAGSKEIADAHLADAIDLAARARDALAKEEFTRRAQKAFSLSWDDIQRIRRGDP